MVSFAAGIVTLILALATPSFFVNIPRRDDWAIVLIMDKILDGRVQFADFWTPHCEHRLLIPRLILSYWATWTRWDLRGVPWLDLALVFIGTVWVAGLANKEKVFWKNQSFWAAATFTFSLPALKAINWSIILNTYLSAALAVGAIACIALRPLSFRRWVMALLSAVVSTFSFGSGVAVWVAALPFLVAVRKSPKFGAIAALWVGSAALFLAIYFSGMDFQKHPSLFISLNHMGTTIHFFITYLGALFFPWRPDFFGVLGLILSGTLCVDTIRRTKQGDLGTVGLLSAVLFVFVTAFLTTMSFSVHDTIVVFDRIREYSKRTQRVSLDALCDQALTETMGRSLTNSLTLILMLLALVLMGGETIRWFIVALLIGTTSGAYSSPFIATPILILWDKWDKRKSRQ